MIVSSAQIKTTNNDTHANIQKHLDFIELAAQQKVQLIVFPEMSLTGYEREMADELSFSENDSRLNVFKERAVSYQMLIIVGAPIKRSDQLHIGSFIFLPDGTCKIYTKQFLHNGEEKFFSPNFNFNPLMEVENEKISIAICADITHPIHAQNASKNNTSLYVASIFYTPAGIAGGYQQLSDYAKKYSMNVLMANYVGTSYHFEGAGKSAFWDKKGNLVKQLNTDKEELLIIEI